jgi:hypothetical protein
MAVAIVPDPTTPTRRTVRAEGVPSTGAGLLSTTFGESGAS